MYVAKAVTGQVVTLKVVKKNGWIYVPQYLYINFVFKIWKWQVYFIFNYHIGRYM